MVHRLLIATVALAACNVGGGSGDDGFSMRFSDGPTASRRAATNTQVHALYFGEIEVVAYDHRPGEAVQANVDWGSATQSGIASDWSYLVPMQAGIDLLRDRLVFDAGTVDFAQLEADSHRIDVDADFVSSVGAFDIDYLEVNLYRTGVVYDPTGSGEESEFIYVGTNADGNGLEGSPMHHYPELASIEDRYTAPFFPTWQEIGWQDSSFQDVNVLFADNAVFAQRRVVVLEPASSPSGAGAYVGVRFDSLAPEAALTPAQEQVLLSLANQGTQRRNYTQLLIVPMDAPIRIVYDSDVAAAITTPAAKSLDSDHWQIDVSFDISGALDESLSTVSLDEAPASAAFTVSTATPLATYAFTVDGEDYTVVADASVTTVADVGQQIASELSTLFNDAGKSTVRVSETDDGFEVTSPFPLIASASGANLAVSVQQPSPLIAWAGDANLVPFGLDVTFSTPSAECDVGTAVDEADWCGSYTPGDQPATCCVCPNGTTAGVTSSGGVSMVQCN